MQCTDGETFNVKKHAQIIVHMHAKTLWLFASAVLGHFLFLAKQEAEWTCRLYAMNPRGASNVSSCIHIWSGFRDGAASLGVF